MNFIKRNKGKSTVICKDKEGNRLCQMDMYISNMELSGSGKFAHARLSPPSLYSEFKTNVFHFAICFKKAAIEMVIYSLRARV